jgi:FAD/FMN-containing dehydrogenase
VGEDVHPAQENPMTQTTDPRMGTATPDLSTLRDAVRGRVLLPGDDGFEEASRPWNVAVPQRPAAVVHVADEQDVVSVVRLAREQGFVVSAQPGGHGATEALDATVLLRTAALNEVVVDRAAGIARVGAGVKWGQLLAALDGTGLIAMAGSNPDVSVVGYLLGGGLSWFGRRYGIGSRSLRAAHIVGGDGTLRWVDDTSDPDLMWALRGGGGEFGIVTAVYIALHPEPELHGGKLMFPITQAASVLEAFAEVTSCAPDGLTCWASLMHFPPMPDLPELLRGNSFATVDVTWLGDAGEGADLIAPLREAGTLLSDSFGPVAIGRLGEVAAEPTAPMPFIEWGGVLRSLDETTIERLVGVGGDRTRTALNVLQVRHVGGALAVPGEPSGALDHVGAEYVVFTFGVAAAPELVEPIRASLRGVAAACGPSATARIPLTFLGPDSDLSAVHDHETLSRLRAIKRLVDPDHVIRGNHPLG